MTSTIVFTFKVLYGDRALTDALDVSLKMILSIPLADIFAYRKMERLCQIVNAFKKVLFSLSLGSDSISFMRNFTFLFLFWALFQFCKERITEGVFLLSGLGSRICVAHCTLVVLLSSLSSSSIATSSLSSSASISSSSSVAASSSSFTTASSSSSFATAFSASPLLLFPLFVSSCSPLIMILTKAYFAFMEVLFSNHISFILNLGTNTFLNIIGSLEAGLKGLDTGISSQIRLCASAVDNLATFYFNHITSGEILRTLFEIILFEDCGNQWSLSRPMLSLILLNEQNAPSLTKTVK
ncbi:hypothetical protein C4D60_Mb09t16100 [Musa balbisiana]|uniref:Uncharacterized protein n=1 Tax=Musa balbisiana TaxID=52838 RepID=A0A4S8IJ99_MUSBA|nr:hypothetical protein C4D60_Mb09t16100 [Musa balbisiana]